MLYTILGNHVKDCDSGKGKYHNYINSDSSSIADFFCNPYKFPSCYSVLPVNKVNFGISTIIDGLLLQMFRRYKGVEKRKKINQIFGQLEMEPYYNDLKITSYLLMEEHIRQMLEYIYIPASDVSAYDTTSFLLDLRTVYWPPEEIRAYKNVVPGKKSVSSSSSKVANLGSREEDKSVAPNNDSLSKSSPLKSVAPKADASSHSKKVKSVSSTKSKRVLSDSEESDDGEQLGEVEQGKS